MQNLLDATGEPLLSALWKSKELLLKFMTYGIGTNKSPPSMEGR